MRKPPSRGVSLSKLRFCGPCQEEHHIGEFYQSRKPNGTLNFHCRKALAARRAARGNTPEDRAYAKAWRAANQEKFMVAQARSRAKLQGVPFNITWQDVTIPEFCPLLGIKLERCDRGHGYCPGSPSLDKIDPTLGYVKGNVWVISMRANLMKNDASPDELRRFARGVREHFGD